MTHTAERGAHRWSTSESVVIALISAVGLSMVCATALLPIEVTAGWSDQVRYHLPTIEGFAAGLPSVDIVDVQTATSPLYHLVLGILMRTLGLSAAAVQVAAGWAGITVLGAVAVIATRRVLSPVRYLIVASVVVSPYVLESTLWLSTDATAMVFAMLALVALVRMGDDSGAPLCAGVAIALAIATRQTYAWLLLPGAIAAMQGRKPRAVRFVTVCAPGAGVLALLVAAWGGLTPPDFAGINGTGPSPAGVSFGFGLVVFLIGPSLLALGLRPRQFSRKQLVVAVAVGAACAAPALVWASGYTESSNARVGGWLWTLIRQTGSIGERSPVLAGLAFLGGVLLVSLIVAFGQAGCRSQGIIVGAAICGSIVASSAGAQTFQRYYELPLLVCYLVAVATGWNYMSQRTRPNWLLVPAALQIFGSLIVVGLPAMGSLA